MLKDTIEQLHKKLLNKQITPLEIVNAAYEGIEKLKKYNALIISTKSLAVKLAQQLSNTNIENNNMLFAIPYFSKDNFITKNIRTTASSHILDNFIPPFNSTIIELLEQNSTILLGKTALDELGMGGHGLYAHTGKTYNPWDHSRIVGGSSSGSAIMIAKGVAPFALGSDTGDSIRKPASYVGIVGFKPTYGIISRYGLISYAPSLDTVGFFTRTVADSAILIDNLAKYDKRDATSQPSNLNCYQNLDANKAKQYRFALLASVQEKLNDQIKQLFNNLLVYFKKENIIINKIEFDEQLLQALAPVYMIISYAEAVSTHSNLDGINFGVREKGDTYEEVMINSRTHGFGNEVKLRYIIGAYALEKDNQKLLFEKAKKVRRCIVNELKKIFHQFDILLLPSAKSIAPKIIDVKNKKLNKDDVYDYIDDVLILANFMGNPSLTVPLGFVDDLPFGININSDLFKEQKVLNAGLLIENYTGLKNIIATFKEKV